VTPSHCLLCSGEIRSLLPRSTALACVRSRSFDCEQVCRQHLHEIDCMTTLRTSGAASKLKVVSSIISHRQDGGVKCGLLGRIGVMCGGSKDTWASDAVVHVECSRRLSHSFQGSLFGDQLLDELPTSYEGNLGVVQCFDRATVVVSGEDEVSIEVRSTFRQFSPSHPCFPPIPQSLSHSSCAPSR